MLFAVKVPDAVKLPVELIAPVTDVVPVMFVVPRLLVPVTVRLLSTCKLLDGIKILPVPLARNSKSAFDAVVVIKFVSIRISSTSTSLTYKFLNAEFCNFLGFQIFQKTPTSFGHRSYPLGSLEKKGASRC